MDDGRGEADDGAASVVAGADADAVDRGWAVDAAGEGAGEGPALEQPSIATRAATLSCWTGPALTASAVEGPEPAAAAAPGMQAAAPGRQAPGTQAAAQALRAAPAAEAGAAAGP